MTDAIKTLDADVELTLSNFQMNNVEAENAEGLVKLMQEFIADEERDITLCKCDHKGWNEGFISYILLVEGYSCAFIYRHKVKGK